jgi:hypothetical protein
VAGSAFTSAEKSIDHRLAVSALNIPRMLADTKAQVVLPQVASEPQSNPATAKRP